MAGGTVTLAEFLLARIAEDRRAFAAIEHYPYNSRDDRWESEFGESSFNGTAEPFLTAVLRVKPSRVFAECAAKQRIVERCALVLAAFDDPDAGPWTDVTRRERTHANLTLEALALPYADHEQFREEWRP